MRFGAPTSVSLKKMCITYSQPSIYVIPTYLRFPPMDSTTDHVVLWYLCSVTQSYLTLCDPMDCSPPGSSVHGIFQARLLEWVAISFSKACPEGLVFLHIILLTWIGVFQVDFWEAEK